MSENKKTVTITSEGITTTVISKEGISIINEGLGEISFKLSNKKTPQDVRDQEELVKVTMQIDGKQIAEVITQR